MKKNRSGMTRRRFIQSSAGAFAAVTAYGLIPSSDNITGLADPGPEILRRKLGKTGLDVSLLSFGGGSQFLRNQNGDWEQVLEAAVEGGINLFDTASTYTAASFNQGGSKSPDSEDRYGQLLTRHRNKIILSTKLESRDPEKARLELEASLKRLKTDHVDILLFTRFCRRQHFRN
jgi:aryl-alcohol dehydrogenase-like predicted oxidoreductase